MRDITEPWRDDLIEFTAAQKRAAENARIIAGALATAKRSDDKLDIAEIFAVAIANAPAAFAAWVELVEDPTPFPQDAINVGFMFFLQLAPFSVSADELAAAIESRRSTGVDLPPPATVVADASAAAEAIPPAPPITTSADTSASTPSSMGGDVPGGEGS